MAVPVAIIGTFAVMAALGFSLNNLTLFGLVLAIGIVVDDAIVVVEAVEHHIEHGLAPREATIKAMTQVSGPVIAVGLVLSAVFVPCAFISGITGPVLPAVRLDHRHLDADLGVQLADAQPCAVGRALAAAREGARMKCCRGRLCSCWAAGRGYDCGSAAVAARPGWIKLLAGRAGLPPGRDHARRAAWWLAAGRGGRRRRRCRCCLPGR